MSTLKNRMGLLAVVALGIFLVAPAANAATSKSTGTQGNDVMLGSLKSNLEVGLDGNDQLYGCAHYKKYKGGGYAYLSCDPKDRHDNDRLYGNGGRDLVWGGGGSDYVSGGPGADRVQGDAGSDTVSGGPGADQIKGGGGNDRLLGGFGNDVIRDASGANRIYCGGGYDTVWTNARTKTFNCESVR